MSYKSVSFCGLFTHHFLCVSNKLKSAEMVKYTEDIVNEYCYVRERAQGTGTNYLQIHMYEKELTLEYT